jgi:hypothetical protein
MDMPKIMAWSMWQAHGWTAEDLKLVVRHLKTKIAQERKWPSALQFRNLIERPDLFEEELAEARALARIPVIDPGRKQALLATGRSTQVVQTEPRPAGDVIAAARALEDFRAWRQATGI